MLQNSNQINERGKIYKRQHSRCTNMYMIYAKYMLCDAMLFMLQYCSVFVFISKLAGFARVPHHKEINNSLIGF